MLSPIERLLAYHCAPALAGIKPANLVSCAKDKSKSLSAEIRRLSNELSPRGITLEILCECAGRALIMAYRRDLLSRCLSAPDMRRFLVENGYPKEFSPEGYLETLKQRLSGKDFPHEIGAFLGYPLHDIRGFIDCPNGCIFTGEWKVYAEADKARTLFRRYRDCRRAMAVRARSGESLCTILQ